ncbi:AMP-binding protein [Candidatus Skiveiella danica]|uniref:AMP-binding protein n=1 Tax=Candidatus Skiveiella danica TaxID=3386177 RepID=UPI0039B8E11A
MAFTSGTTGKPAAVHTHRDVLAGCEAWPRHVLRWATPDDIVMGSPPLAFTFGLGLLVSLMWGRRLRISPIFRTRLSHGQAHQRGGRHPLLHRNHVPNTGNGAVCQHGVPTLRICGSAGEGLPDATRQPWKDATGIEMPDGIGATAERCPHLHFRPGRQRGAARRHR